MTVLDLPGMTKLDWGNATETIIAVSNWQEYSIVLAFKCKALRFDSNSNQMSRFEFDSKVTFPFENFESLHMPCAVIPQTTLTHCSTKTSTFAPFVVEIYVYNSTLHVAVLL